MARSILRGATQSPIRYSSLTFPLSWWYRPSSARLTWAATAALVVFTTVQATAVFSEILSGAALFILVGVVLLGTGILADRGRRRLVREGREAAS